MEKQFIQHYNDGDRFMLQQGKTIVNVFDNKRAQAGAHLVFCLDGSGSMEGQPWQELMVSYKHLLHTRITDHQAVDDLVSVLVFNSEADIRFELEPITTAPRDVTFATGGTRFTPALKAAGALLSRERGGDYTPVLVFMSDGVPDGSRGDTDSDQIAAMRQIVQIHGGHGLKVYTVPFGREADRRRMENLATEGKGTMLAASSGAELMDVFEQIGHVAVQSMAL